LSISQFEITYNIFERQVIIIRLKDIREDRDITQSEVAAYLHVKQNTYSQYENGKRSLPIDMLILLAEFFETSSDYILEITDDSRPYPRKTDK